jgi:hypothetical protein
VLRSPAPVRLATVASPLTAVSDHSGLSANRFCTSPRLHLADGGRFRFSLCPDHFGLLPWIVTAHRAATTTTPRRPGGAGGGKSI